MRECGADARVDGDEIVEELGEEGAHHPLAHDFAGLKAMSLAHVGKVGAHQGEPSRAELAQCATSSSSTLFVRLVKAAGISPTWGQVRREPEPELLIRKRWRHWRRIESRRPARRSAASRSSSGYSRGRLHELHEYMGQVFGAADRVAAGPAQAWRANSRSDA